MKEFIYLDTSYLASALAQINKGNIISFTGENTDTSQTINNSSASKVSESKFGINTPLKVAFGSNNSTVDENTLLDISSAKEIITKKFDDYAYNILYKHIKDSEKLKYEDFSNGDFALISGSYELIDFNFINTLLDDDFIELYVNNELNSKVFGNATEKNLQQKQNKFKSDRKKFYLWVRKQLLTFQKVIPSDTMLIINNIIAPINSEFLRGNFKDISFKYDKINMLTRITRAYHQQQYDGAKMLIHAIDHMLPSVLEMFNIKFDDNTLIATPIAIYIE